MSEFVNEIHADRRLKSQACINEILLKGTTETDNIDSNINLLLNSLHDVWSEIRKDTSISLSNFLFSANNRTNSIIFFEELNIRLFASLLDHSSISWQSIHGSLLGLNAIFPSVTYREENLCCILLFLSHQQECIRDSAREYILKSVSSHSVQMIDVIDNLLKDYPNDSDYHMLGILRTLTSIFSSSEFNELLVFHRTNDSTSLDKFLSAIDSVLCSTSSLIRQELCHTLICLYRICFHLDENNTNCSLILDALYGPLHVALRNYVHNTSAPEIWPGIETSLMILNEIINFRFTFVFSPKFRNKVPRLLACLELFSKNLSSFCLSKSFEVRRMSTQLVSVVVKFLYFYCSSVDDVSKSALSSFVPSIVDEKLEPIAVPHEQCPKQLDVVPISCVHYWLSEFLIFHIMTLDIALHSLDISSCHFWVREYGFKILEADHNRQYRQFISNHIESKDCKDYLWNQMKLSFEFILQEILVKSSLHYDRILSGLTISSDCILSFLLLQTLFSSSSISNIKALFCDVCDIPMKLGEFTSYFDNRISGLFRKQLSLVVCATYVQRITSIPSSPVSNASVSCFSFTNPAVFPWLSALKSHLVEVASEILLDSDQNRTFQLSIIPLLTQISSHTMNDYHLDFVFDRHTVSKYGPSGPRLYPSFWLCERAYSLLFLWSECEIVSCKDYFEIVLCLLCWLEDAQSEDSFLVKVPFIRYAVKLFSKPNLDFNYDDSNIKNLVYIILGTIMKNITPPQAVLNRNIFLQKVRLWISISGNFYGLLSQVLLHDDIIPFFNILDDLINYLERDVENDITSQDSFSDWDEDSDSDAFPEEGSEIELKIEIIRQIREIIEKQV